MNSINKFAAFMLVAFVAMPAFADKDKDAKKDTGKKEEKKEKSVLYAGSALQAAESNPEAIKKHANGLTVKQLKEALSKLDKVKAAYKNSKKTTNWPGYDYKLISTEDKKKLGIESMNDWNIHLLVQNGESAYKAVLKEKQNNEPLKKKFFNREYLKALIWADRTKFQKAGIIAAAVAATAGIGYGVKQAVHPATRGEKNIKALEDLVDRADRAESGEVEVLDQDALEHILSELTLVSEQSRGQIAAFAEQGQFAELINFVASTVMNEVANNPAADKRDGIFSKFGHNDKDEDVFAQAE